MVACLVCSCYLCWLFVLRVVRFNVWFNYFVLVVYDFVVLLFDLLVMWI